MGFVRSFAAAFEPALLLAVCRLTVACLSIIQWLLTMYRKRAEGGNPAIGIQSTNQIGENKRLIIRLFACCFSPPLDCFFCFEKPATVDREKERTSACASTTTTTNCWPTAPVTPTTPGINQQHNKERSKFFVLTTGSFSFSA